MSAAGARLRLVGPAPVAGALRAGAAVADGRTPQAFAGFRDLLGAA